MMKLVVGPGTVCYVNGRPFGACTGLEYEAGTPREAQRGVDCVIPFEEAPTIADFTGSMTVLRQVGDGGAQGALVSTEEEDLPRQRYFNVALVDRHGDTRIFQADYCALVSERWGLPVRGFMTGTLSFKALTWSTEHSKLR